MTSDLPEAYCKVHSSVKEIIKNNQRHLYINMLGLLNRTIRASGAAEKNFMPQEHLEFWCNDILSLAFDENKTIQDSAIVVLESALQYLEDLKNQNSPEWQGIKKIIVETYSKKLDKLRQTSNSNWYKIWCLLIRILDKEILKGATVINTFLAIVEYGFRSNDYKIRAEAFICWKVLVEIFAKYDEIFSPKRIKLICIPLKSSQSKTLETAVNKFKVWWYFICKLSSKMEDYVDTILLPFLTFCFGPTEKNVASSVSAQGKMYPQVKKMAVNCLIELLGPSVKNGVLQSFILEQPHLTIITPEMMSKYSKPIISACIEATLLLTDEKDSSTPIYNRLWSNLIDQMASTNNLDVFCECITQISSLITNEQCKTNKVFRIALSQIIELLVTNVKFPFSQKFDSIAEVSKLCDLINTIAQMICHPNLQLPTTVKMLIIGNIYNLERYRYSSNYGDIQKAVMETLMDQELCKLEHLVKVDIWKMLCPQIVNYLKDKIFEFRLEKNADLLNRWLMWPLDKIGKLNDAKFFECWKNLSSSASRAEGYSNFTEHMTVHLRNLYRNENKLFKFPLIIGYFIDALDIGFDINSKPDVALEFINNILSKSANNCENHNKILEHLTSYVHKLGENQIIDAHPRFTAIYTTLVRNTTPNAFDKSLVDNFKRTYQDKLKTSKARDKKLLKDIKDIEKNDSNVFVIIPNLWTYNPEKMTEHQKEKREEIRTDIPALYNDMTQSQDTSVKPWTPKKIVIAKGKSSEEIVLHDKDSNENDEAIVEEQQENVQPNVKNNININNINNDMNGTEVRDNAEKKKKDNKLSDTSEKNKSVSENEAEKKKNKVSISKSDEQLLDKCNVQVIDDTKKLEILKKLKAMEIDTVEGRPIVTEKLRSRPSKNEENLKKNDRKNMTPRNIQQLTKRQKPTIGKQDENSGKIKKGTSKLSERVNDIRPTEKDNIVETGKAEEKNAKLKNEDDSMDDIVESSQVSESVLAKKVPLRRSINSTNRTNLPSAHKRLNFEAVDDQQIEEEEIIPDSDDISNDKEQNEIRNSPAKLQKLDAYLTKSATDNVNDMNISKDDCLNNENPKISEMETQPNTEMIDESSSVVNMVNVDDKFKTPLKEVSPTNKSRITSPKKVVSPSYKQRVSELDTEPNTEPTNISKDNSFSKLVNCKNNLESPNCSLLDDSKIDDDSKNGINNSIFSSPELKDTSERNAELLNNTINISPIPVDSLISEKNLNAEIDDDETTKSATIMERKLAKPFSVSDVDRKMESAFNRSKPNKHLTGRGAQLINMIRNKNKLQNSTVNVKNEERNSPENSSPTIVQNSSKIEQAVTPAQHRDLLTFSKKVPSPHASPSASILKRKMLVESFDDIETPLNKRKRVSFHDPPVSLTKEYERLSEEKATKSGLNRCLMTDKTSTPQDQSRLRHSLKRKSRVDSMIEIAKFNETPAKEICNNFGHTNNVQFGQTTVEMDHLRWNNNSLSEGEDDHSLTPSPSICFSDEQAILNHVFEKYELQDIIEKYENGSTVNSSSNILIKTLLTIMSKNDKIKTNVLEILSEKHPKEFLEHAIQENICSVVCEKLNSISVIEYLYHQSKVDKVIRTKLLEQIQKLLVDQQWTNESFKFILPLLENHQMNKEEMFIFTEAIFERHKANKAMPTDNTCL